MLLIFGFLFLAFIFTVTGILTGLFLIPYIDLPSALMIIVPLIFFLIITKSGNVIVKYIKTSFKKNHAYSRPELACLALAIKNTVKFVLGTGGFGFLFGVVAIIRNLENRDMLGPNLSVSLLTVLYSILIAFFVFFPTQAWAENKISAMENTNEPVSST